MTTQVENVPVTVQQFVSCSTSEEEEVAVIPAKKWEKLTKDNLFSRRFFFLLDHLPCLSKPGDIWSFSNPTGVLCYRQLADLVGNAMHTSPPQDSQLPRAGHATMKCRTDGPTDGVSPLFVERTRVSPLSLCLRQSVDIARTAAWAISNLARGDKTPATPFLEVADETIAALTGTAPGAPQDEQLRVEAAWILAFVTAKDDEVGSKLVQKEMVPALIQALVDSRGEVSMSGKKCHP